MLGKYWENYPHGADIGLRGIGATKEEAFEQAAMALTAAITDPQNVAHLEEIEVSCQAPDDEIMLAVWLNELVRQMAARRMLFSRYEVRINDHTLEGRAWGEEVSRERHHPAVHVKGATCTDLCVQEDDTGTWLAQCAVGV
ncbi:MAG TPA: archease [Blastocatellia bacterium]|nr:archease [Blastocatellia bacterium]